MLEFIKMFGLGIVYTILSPLILAIFLLFVIYSFFNYLVLEVVNFFTFFTGRRFTIETKLEKDMKKELENRQPKAVATSANQTPMNNSMDVTINSVQTPLNNNSKGGDLNA